MWNYRLIRDDSWYSMYGDLEGMLGGKLAQVEYLELGDGL